MDGVDCASPSVGLGPLAGFGLQTDGALPIQFTEIKSLSTLALERLFVSLVDNKR